MSRRVVHGPSYDEGKGDLLVMMIDMFPWLEDDEIPYTEEDVKFFRGWLKVVIQLEARK